MKRIEKYFLLVVLTLGLAILPALISNNQVYAATITKTEQMVITFGTTKLYSADNQVFDIGFTYEMHPKSNEPNTLSETVRLQNGASIEASSKILAVKVYGSDGKEYAGSFSFNYSYNSKTGVLLVNNSAVAFNTHILVNATVFPEA